MTAYKFCTIEDVKPLTRMSSDWTGFHDMIQKQIIPLATKQVQNFCRRTFIPATYVEYFATQEVRNSYTKFWLTELNVSAAALRLDYNWPLDWSTITPVDASLYRLDAARGIITLLAATCEHAESLQVTYTGGFALDVGDPTLVMVPDDLRLASALQTSFLLDRILNQEVGQDSKRVSERLAIKMLESSVLGVCPEVQAMIGHYRQLLTGKLSHGRPVYI